MRRIFRCLRSGECGWKHYDVRDVFPYINETALFKNQWQLKTASQADYVRLVEEKFRPIKKKLEEEVAASRGCLSRKSFGDIFPARVMGMMWWCMKSECASRQSSLTLDRTGPKRHPR